MAEEHKYAWGENTGWISLSCQDSGTCDDVEYGVVVDPCNGTINSNGCFISMLGD